MTAADRDGLASVISLAGGSAIETREADEPGTDPLVALMADWLVQCEARGWRSEVVAPNIVALLREWLAGEVDSAGERTRVMERGDGRTVAAYRKALRDRLSLPDPKENR